MQRGYWLLCAFNIVRGSITSWYEKTSWTACIDLPIQFWKWQTSARTFGTLKCSLLIADDQKGRKINVLKLNIDFPVIIQLSSMKWIFESVSLFLIESRSADVAVWFIAYIFCTVHKGENTYHDIDTSLMIGKILPIFECLKNENFHNQLTATDEIIQQ